MRGGLLSFAILGFLSPIYAHAADIYVDVTADDTAGRQFAYELRERVAQSARHNLVHSPDDAAFVLAIVTMDDEKSYSTVYSATLTMQNFSDPDMFSYFIESWVGRCGASVMQSCAAKLSADVDAEIEPIVRAVSEVLKAPRNQAEGNGADWPATDDEVEALPVT